MERRGFGEEQTIAAWQEIEDERAAAEGKRPRSIEDVVALRRAAWGAAED